MASIALAGVSACGFSPDSKAEDASPDRDAAPVDAPVGQQRGDRIDCTPLAPIDNADREVDSAAQLLVAVANAGEGETIALLPGTYVFNERIEIASRGLTLRSKSGRASDVVIEAPTSVFNVFVIRSSDVTFAAMTIRGARRGVRVEPPEGVPSNNLRFFDLTVEGFSESGIEVEDSPMGDTAFDGEVSCSRISPQGAAGQCPGPHSGIDLRSASSGWRISENLVRPGCLANAVSNIHRGIRLSQGLKRAVVDHNRVSDFETAIQVGERTPPTPLCDGEAGVGWDAFAILVCANSAASSAAQVTAGLFHRQACDSLAVFNTIAMPSTLAQSIRADGQGSVVGHANNAITGVVGGSQPTVPPLSGPDLTQLTPADFVDFPNNLRLRAPPTGALDLASEPQIEAFCSWDLDGVERDPENPGFGAFAPTQ